MFKKLKLLIGRKMGFLRECKYFFFFWFDCFWGIESGFVYFKSSSSRYKGEGFGCNGRFEKSKRVVIKYIGL